MKCSGCAKRLRRCLRFSLFILLVLMIVASGGMYVVEHDVQPEAFGSIPRAMWWAAVTLITVGYGDVSTGRQPLPALRRKAGVGCG